MPLDPGLAACVSMVVTGADTALAMGSGDVEVLATPRLIALCEAACVRAAARVVTPPQTSVGGRVHFDHLAPVKVGSSVTAEATLEKVEGRRLQFTVTANDASGLVGVGRMTRVVVDVDHFLAKAR
ncbi:MAG: thioesterase family protein [Acidimicrobiales bacterium]